MVLEGTALSTQVAIALLVHIYQHLELDTASSNGTLSLANPLGRGCLSILDPLVILTRTAFDGCQLCIHERPLPKERPNCFHPDLAFATDTRSTGELILFLLSFSFKFLDLARSLLKLTAVELDQPRWRCCRIGLVEN